MLFNSAPVTTRPLFLAFSAATRGPYAATSHQVILLVVASVKQTREVPPRCASLPRTGQRERGEGSARQTLGIHGLADSGTVAGVARVRRSNGRAHMSAEQRSG